MGRPQVSADIAAGITMAALAIPEVMGYAKIAGTPVITGLYTMLIPMFLFAFFGSSRHLVVAADSATAALLFAGLRAMAAPGSSEWMAYAGVLALMSAALLFVARIVRLGFLADFLSHTVLVGFLTGVGVQVALGEISGMLGLEVSRHSLIWEIMDDIQQIGNVNFYAVTVSIAVILIIVVTDRLSNNTGGTDSGLLLHCH